MWVRGQRHTPAALTPEKSRYPLYRRPGGPQGRSGPKWKISPPPEFDPRTFQSVASRYTDWNIPAHGKVIEEKECILPAGIKTELILKSSRKYKDISDIESSEIRSIYYKHCQVSVAIEALWFMIKVLIHWSWWMHTEYGSHSVFSCPFFTAVIYTHIHIRITHFHLYKV